MSRATWVAFTADRFFMVFRKVSIMWDIFLKPPVMRVIDVQNQAAIVTDPRAAKGEEFVVTPRI
jgi:hypothetical protein